MTCYELQYVFESSSQSERKNFLRESATVFHLAGCSECKQWLEVRRQMARQIGLLRDGAPPPSALLDVKVLEAYRNFSGKPLQNGKRRSRGRRLCWQGALVTAAAAILLLIISSRSKTQPAHNKAVEVHAPAPVLSPATAQEPPLVTQRRKRPGRSAVVEKNTVREERNRTRLVPNIVAQSDYPGQAFRSLMYCDPLSCAGPMQVVRVPLPPTSPPGVRARYQQSYAEYLVGEDGVARAVRLVNYPN